MTFKMKINICLSSKWLILSWDTSIHLLIECLIDVPNYFTIDNACVTIGTKRNGDGFENEYKATCKIYLLWTKMNGYLAGVSH